MGNMSDHKQLKNPSQNNEQINGKKNQTSQIQKSLKQ